jgi:hypothetical protein
MFSGHSYSGNYASPAPSNIQLYGRQTTKNKDQDKEEVKGRKNSSSKKKNNKKKHKKRHESSEGIHIY